MDYVTGVVQKGQSLRYLHILIVELSWRRRGNAAAAGEGEIKEKRLD